MGPGVGLLMAEWFDEVLRHERERERGAGAGAGEKPNPSLVGRSRFPHSQVWLQSEREILEWWESVRGDLRVPIARNGRDSALLHYEKEVLQWWHGARADEGFVAETAVVEGEVWRVNGLHQQYETELATWWNEKFREGIYSETVEERLAALYGQIGDLRAFWSMFNVAVPTVEDDSGNDLDLTVNFPASFSTGTALFVPYVSLSEPAAANLLRAHSSLLTLGDEATMGCWVRIGTAQTSGPILHKGAAGAQTYVDFSYDLSSDADNGYFCSFKQANGTVVSESVELADYPSMDPLSWHFVVARFKRGGSVVMQVDRVRKTAVVADSPLAAVAQPFVVAQEIDNGVNAASMDVALPFVAAVSVSDTLLDVIYTTTRALLGV